MSLDEFIKYNKIVYGVEPKISPLNYDNVHKSFIISQFDNVKNVFIYFLDDVTNKKIIFGNEDQGYIETLGLTKCFNLYEILEYLKTVYNDVYLYPLCFNIKTFKEITEVETTTISNKGPFARLIIDGLSLFDTNEQLVYTGEFAESIFQLVPSLEIINNLVLDSYECIPRCLKLEYDPVIQLW